MRFNSFVCKGAFLRCFPVVPIEVRQRKLSIFTGYPAVFSHRCSQPCNTTDTVDRIFCNANSVTVYGLLIGPNPDPAKATEDLFRWDFQTFSHAVNLRLVRSYQLELDPVSSHSTIPPVECRIDQPNVTGSTKALGKKNHAALSYFSSFALRIRFSRCSGVSFCVRNPHAMSSYWRMAQFPHMRWNLIRKS